MNSTPEQHPEHSRRRIGGVMLVLCWVVVIGVVTMLFTGLLEEKHNPNTRVNSTILAGGEAQIRLRQNALGHYVATGTLNGESARFLLDTGATNVSVPAQLARTLRLPRGAAVPAQTANGTVTTYQTRIAEVRLGDIVMHNVRASINPGMDGEEVLLGMSFLRHLDLRQQDGTLTLTAPQQTN